MKAARSVLWGGNECKVVPSPDTAEMGGRGIHDNGLSEDTSTVLRDGSIDGGNIQIIYITQTSHTIWCDEP